MCAALRCVVDFFVEHETRHQRSHMKHHIPFTYRILIVASTPHWNEQP